MSHADLAAVLAHRSPESSVLVSDIHGIFLALSEIARQQLDLNTAYSTWDKDKLISEDVLAQWLDESPNSIQKWRLTGKGPKYIKNPKLVRYRVGDVRKWIDQNSVTSTANYRANRL